MHQGGYLNCFLSAISEGRLSVACRVVGTCFIEGISTCEQWQGCNTSIQNSIAIIRRKPTFTQEESLFCQCSHAFHE